LKNIFTSLGVDTNKADATDFFNALKTGAEEAKKAVSDTEKEMKKS